MFYVLVSYMSNLCQNCLFSGRVMKYVPSVYEAGIPSAKSPSSV
jgi:hypothetical protein